MYDSVWKMLIMVIIFNLFIEKIVDQGNNNEKGFEKFII